MGNRAENTPFQNRFSVINFKYLFEKDILINMFKNVLVRRIIISFYYRLSKNNNSILKYKKRRIPVYINVTI